LLAGKQIDKVERKLQIERKENDIRKPRLLRNRFKCFLRGF
jgi:hypothetical protein